MVGIGRAGVGRGAQLSTGLSSSIPSLFPGGLDLAGGHSRAPLRSGW